MAFHMCLCIIPAIASRVTRSLKLVYNIFRNRVRILTRPRKPVSGESIFSARLVAEWRLEDPVYADITILEAEKRGNNETSFSISYYDFSQYFLFSRDPAFHVHSDFDDWSLPSQFHASRFFHSMYYEVYITYFSRNSPSEGTAEARSDMNSTRQSRPPRMLKRLQGAYLQRYMRERMDLRDRRILSTGAQSDNTENLVQNTIKTYSYRHYIGGPIKRPIKIFL